MLRAFKYRIYPTKEQEILMSKMFGCVRFVFNWALNEIKTAYEKDKTHLNYISLINRLPELKNEFEWLKEPGSQSLQYAIKCVHISYTNFFRTRKGYPKFKSKKSKQSCTFPQGVKVLDGYVFIPKLKYVKAKIHRSFNGTIKSATLSKNPSGTYYISILVDTNTNKIPTQPISEDKTIGIDVGVKTLVTCSDGRTFENHKYLERSLNRLKLLQQRLSSKEKGSKNRNKARIKLAKLHEHIRNQRLASIHKITYSLTHDNQVGTICIENLSVSKMIEKGDNSLSRRLSDASMSSFLTILKYKCDWYGINLISIDKYYPSSKTCSHCGHVNSELKLSDREWTCPNCNSKLDRDLNAAINVKKVGPSIF